MSIKDLEFNSDIDKVVGIQFSLFSPEEIERKSVAEITTHETYDGDIPKIGGLYFILICLIIILSNINFLNERLLIKLLLIIIINFEL